MRRSLSRRSLTAGSLAAMLAGSLSTHSRLIAAQDGGALSGLDLPTLDITVTADGFGGVAEEIEAGRYIVTVTPDEGVEPWGVAFVQPPEGLTADQFILELESATMVESQEDTTPEVTPVVDPLPAGQPVVAYDARYAGGVVGTTGMMSAQVVVDIDAGEWILMPGDPLGEQSPLIFQATGEMPDDLPEPEADIDVTLSDGEITIGGAMTAGDHVLRVAHDGEEPHRLELLRGPDGMTGEELEPVLQGIANPEIDPAELPFDPATDLSPSLMTGAISGGATLWVAAPLETGTYAAVCFYPAQEDSTPHALNGEYTIFTVE